VSATPHTDTPTADTANPVTDNWPIPTAESLEHFQPWGHGARFFLRSDGDEGDEMSYDALKFVVRNSEEFAFPDGETIEEASSHSNAELWSDVILPAIADGRIQVTVWGEPL
jgi:hypothetical protein